jgi:hypothetical protein
MTSRAVTTTFVLLLSSGCPSSALPTNVGFLVQSKYGLHTLDTCTSAPELVALLNRAVPVVLEEMERAGLAKRADLEASLRKKPAYGCFVEQPQPCAVTPDTCTAHLPVCARRRGCTIEGVQFWVSRYWPPVCRADWPDEPCGVGCRCSAGPAQQSSAGWQRDAIGEVVALFCARAGCYGEPALDARKLQVIKKTMNGLEL